MPSDKTRPMLGYRLPKNQEWRRRTVIELSETATKALDEALALLADSPEQARAQVKIVTAIRKLVDIRNHMIAAQYGPEQPTEE